MNIIISVLKIRNYIINTSSAVHRRDIYYENINSTLHHFFIRKLKCSMFLTVSVVPLRAVLVYVRRGVGHFSSLMDKITLPIDPLIACRVRENRKALYAHRAIVGVAVK